ncbi:aspartic proteinase CDR1-like [Euphorbia lathyris]|uniref:aspartic proteinase CDR1-like n=1 Tax=Euphorbia lathyris TaxID=212925 RepID=UPI003313927E
MAAAMLFYHDLSTTMIAFFAFLFLTSEASHTGFHVDLIHRDSPNSPFFNPSETHSERLINALQRSVSRINHHFKPSLSYSPNTPQTKIVSNQGEYLMEISIGTPPVRVLGIADTGSDLIWTQCKPCNECYAQNDPLFDPKASSTYQEIACNTELCQSLGKRICQKSKKQDICHYSAFYGDKSFSHGILAFETVTLGSTSGRPIYFPRTAFGCGYNNNGTFDREGSGIIGLGRGASSFITRMYSSIGGKFSHCLVPILSKPGETSKMNFGSKAVISGPGVVSTPLIQRDEANIFYFLTLEAISVGDKRLEYNDANNSSPNLSSREGNMIIDSGTTLTFLPQGFYVRVESAVIEAIKGLERVHDPQLLPLCYKTKLDNLGAPVITMHFTNADVKLYDINSFVRVSEDVVCFSFSYTSDFQYSIYGNLAQMNFLVGYDLEGKTVSFKKADCTKR